MRKRTEIFILLAVIIFAATLACDTKKTEPKKKTNRFFFTESSKGLPLSGQWRHNIAFYDINGDGNLDILAPPPRGATDGREQPVVWHGDGKGGWSESRLDVPSDIPYRYGGITVSDFDGDKIVDMALAMHGRGVWVLRGTGKGRYVNFSDGLPSKDRFSSRTLLSADLNNDGVSDIAALAEVGLDGRGGRAFYRSDKTWITKPFGNKKERTGLFGDNMAAGDVNGDGNIDLAFGSLNHSNNLIVWLGDGKGGFVPFNKGLPEGKHYPVIDLVDLDKDGRDDLIASITGFGAKGMSSLKAFRSTPDGFEDVSEGLPEREVFFAVKACDLDGDGRDEIVGGLAEGSVKAFSRKESKWNEVSTSGLPKKEFKRLYNLYCVDVDNDGDKDIAVNYSREKGNNGGIRVFLNTPPSADEGQGSVSQGGSE